MEDKGANKSGNVESTYIILDLQRRHSKIKNTETKDLGL